MKNNETKIQMGKIERLFTLGTMYDNQQIGGVTINGDEFRINVSDLLEILNSCTLESRKARKYLHIKPINNRYAKAYNILMDYWDCLPDDEKPKINKKLRELNL